MTSNYAVGTPKRGRPTKEESEARRAREAQANAVFDLLSAGMGKTAHDMLQETVDTVREELLNVFNENVNDLVMYVDTIKDDIVSLEKRRVVIDINGKVSEMKGLRHQKFEDLLRVTALNLSPMLVGPAGSGKTFAAEQVAAVLDLPFYTISVGAQTSKSDLFGYMDANGNYHATMFRLAYENGGVFLMDEIDAGNANVLVLLNSALAGNICAFPDAMVKRHKDFRFIATANTFGTGTNRQYVGRNQLDAATLDRFVSVMWPVDETLEAATIAHYDNGPRWHAVVKTLRALVDKNAWRVVVSPRATMKGAALLDAGATFEETLSMTILASVNEDQLRLLQPAAQQAWNATR